MAEQIFIVTGASRGLGAALAKHLLGPDRVLLCISRQRDEGLDAAATACSARVEQWQADLREPAPVAARLQEWLGSFELEQVAAATLINNAAMLTRAGPLDAGDPAQIAGAVRVGLEAPLLLAAAFLRATSGWTAPRRILNISSGLGRRAMAGQAPYCAVKAGLDHASRAMALDESHRPHGARVVSLAPGVVDTDMQVQLRTSDEAGFPDRANFVGLKQKGQLTAPADAAARIVAFLDRADFGTNPVADVRDA